MRYAILLFICCVSALFSHEITREHPLFHSLETLGKDPTIFSSRERLEAAGFTLSSHTHRGIVIARHRLLKGHLIKLFINSVPEELQLENLRSRINGARALKAFIEKKKLKHIITPQKWLYSLPGGVHILLAEELPVITSSSELKNAYASIDPAVLHELCLVVQEFRGLDSTLKNMPFTVDGKIAFIDTEKWQSPRTAFLPYVRPLLDDELLKIVQKYSDVDSVEKWLMPKKHPIYKKLTKLFKYRELFDSPETLREAGFIVNKRVHQNMMVFTHPSVEGYIFKRFRNKVDQEVQRELYIKRLKGAEIIRNVIKEENIQNIVVPDKWLFALGFDSNEYLVVAKRLDICPGDDLIGSENVNRYQTIDLETLREYCTVLKKIKGCDAWPRNQPFTRDGKIAFIDTEHVGQKEAHFQRHILPLWDPERQEYAKKWITG